MNSLFFFIVANTAVFDASGLLARLANRGGALCTTIVFALLNWLFSVHTIMLGCGLSGRLSPEWVTGVSVLFAVATRLATRGSLTAASPIISVSRLTRPIDFLLIGCLMTAVIVWLKNSLWSPLGTLVWDDQIYHGVYPSLWLRDCRISLDTVYNVKAYYPNSGNLIAL